MLRKVTCILLLACFTSFPLACNTPILYWWSYQRPQLNFGDELSRVIVERIIGRNVQGTDLKTPDKVLFAVGSVLHYARNGDVIWGSGFRENPMDEHRFENLDVRAVRGPRTRNYLLKKGIPCPEVYGDPALLLPFLFPEFKRAEPVFDYIIIPNIGEISVFKNYKNVVLPTLPWHEILNKILQSKLVISSSLHGLIVAEAFGVHARLLKMTWIEPLLKYQDYYESTGRPKFSYATSVQEALKKGGEPPIQIDTSKLLDAFPWDYFE